MPTGYTAGVQDGTVTDFRAFALLCARGMGACIMQREDPSNDLPKYRKAETYNRDRLQESLARLAELQAMSDDEAGTQAAAAFDTALASFRESVERLSAGRARYETMRDEALRWTPPTTEHEGLRDFMVDQLNESIRFDCGNTPQRPVSRSGAQWLADQIEVTVWDIAYYRNSIVDDEARCASSNAWIDALYASLDRAA